MDCKLAVSLMHDYLDDDLSKEQQLELKTHMLSCPDCRMQFKELEQTDMLMYSLTHHTPSASLELTERIMNSLPKQKKQQLWLTWVKRHPAITAAAIFVLVMLFSTVSFWDQDTQLVVKGSDLDQVVIEGNTVIVPEGKSIAGNLTVENGKTQIYGDVQGNLTVIDGSLYQASTAHISGQVKSIDQAMDWIWYKITNMFSDVAYR
ncbi:zf-HC2 domain-containing protein [Paenibacillus cellulositrophicus]|uniref:Anti-sigma-W factor RsiW n=4 Tax=Bacteria TaxID=2 RepID=A0A1R1E978_9BACL|nr:MULTISPECIES: zf-HC2 domain-containing protein [Paenibacillus]MBJ9992528.1 zf-HC2 domain-containing protein [Paenibacillus sp. S28]MCM3002006.1 zf-HC2 domain-containing protein [Paenibacillus cellulositrophicus]OMF48386.1 anti-sigma factor [Paenibacillus rhizosphaerae]OXL87167.1 anti-sigma factor [Paenibacillus sp. SSG-1]PQP86781.1 anti-sigma factor [Paenibacillus sp. AR247]